MAFTDPNKPFIASEILTAVDGERIRIFENDIEMYTGHPDELLPGKITTDTGGSLSVVFRSPELNAFPGIHSNLSMETQFDGTTVFDVDADRSRFFMSEFFQAGAPLIRLGDATPDLDLVIEANASSTRAIIRNETETWHGTADTPLTGTWVDVAGSRFAYMMDATGRVQVRGKVSGGGAGATIVTLPVGYRPTSNLEFTMRAAVGVIASVLVSTAGVLTVTTNLASASANGIFLDVISFPTF